MVLWRSGLRLGAALGGVFVGMILLVEGLGYLTWDLTPKDPEAIRQASEFESVMGRLVRAPNEVPLEGLVGKQTRPILVPDRTPRTPKQVHRVAEWPAENGRNFQEAPMLEKRVKTGDLPVVTKRLPENPLVIVPPHQIGPYGGTWTRFATGPRDVGIVEARFAYEGLVRWDPMGRKVIPNVASRWEISDGGRTFTFWLRPGMRWSDGHLFTVNDLIFWYEDVLQNKDLMPVTPRDFKRGGEVMRLEKVDDATVRFRFKEPNGLFLKKLASGRGYEMLRYPAHYMKQFHPKYVSLEKVEAMGKEVGFDVWNRYFEDRRDWRNPDIPRLWPWIIVAPPPARPAVLERNPYYWKVDPEGNQLPYIDRMTFEIYNLETINLKAMNGEMGMQGRHLQFENYPLFMENQDRGGYRVYHWPSGSGGTMSLALNLNHQDPVLKQIIHDRRFRIALSHALNRAELNEVGYFGIGQPRQISPPPSSDYYVPEYESAYIEYDPELANQLLDEMGLKRDPETGIRMRPDGEILKLFLETTQMNNRVLELVASYWTMVGVETQVKEEARQLFYERKRGLLHDAAVWGGSDEQMPVLDPRWFVPHSDESIHAVDYARWYRTDRKRGETPPPDIQRCIELFWEIEKTIDEKEQVRLFKQIIEWNRKNLWVIGVIGNMPAIYLVKNTFRNVPEVALSGWAFRAPGNTAVECYAIEE
ncbi:MAG: ABC transporter substrate-binding protein [bacterium]|nr:ABC transporter substrate-binding protein [bacterium]